MIKVVRVALAAATAIALVVGSAALTACAQSGPDPARLEGEWKLESFDPASSLGVDPTITTEIKFANGEVSGRGGVNQFSGTYKAGRDGSLTFGEIVSTEMAGPEPAMQQETKFYELLGKTRRFEFNGEKLILDSANNDTLAILAPK